MSNLIEFKKSKIILNEKEIIEDFNFVVKENRHVGVIGPAACGKTTILKALACIAYADEMFIEGYNMHRSRKYIFDKVAVVLNSGEFICENVYSELGFALQNLNKDKNYIKEQVENIAEIFGLTKYLDSDISLLSKEQRILVKILSYLIWGPKVIAIDDLFIYLNREIKDKIMNYINDNKITLLLVTSDIEDTMYTDYIYIMYKQRIITEGYKINIYENCEKLLNKIGYGLPFLPDLSTQLKHYDLLDKIYFSKEELAGDLWK